MNRAFRWRVLVFAVSLGIICGSANRAWAQAEPAPDLASRIDSLEKQLAELKSEMEAQKAALPPLCLPRRWLPPRHQLPLPRQLDLPVCWGQPR